MSTTRKRFLLKWISVVFVFAMGISALLYAGAVKSNTAYADSYTGHTTDNIFMVDGASVRLANGLGIRFTAYYNKSYIDGLDNPTIGMFIAKSENVTLHLRFIQSPFIIRILWINMFDRYRLIVISYNPRCTLETFNLA